jgi:hypothetical protein
VLLHGLGRTARSMRRLAAEGLRREYCMDGMRDLLVVPCGHTFIMNDPEVIAQAFHFLRHGEFDKARK